MRDVWRPVTEAFPLNGTYVVVTGGSTWNGCHWTKAQYDQGIFWDEQGDIELTGITHWMLPSKPKEEPKDA